MRKNSLCFAACVILIAAAMGVFASSVNCKFGNVLPNLAMLSKADVEALALREDDGDAYMHNNQKCYEYFGDCGVKSQDIIHYENGKKVSRNLSYPTLGMVCAAASGYGYYCSPDDCGQCSTTIVW